MINFLLTLLLAPLVALRRRLGPRPPAVPVAILLIQTAKIGDYVCTTPLIRALRAQFPHARLALLVGAAAAPLARQQPGVDQVFVLEAALQRGWSGRLALYRLLRREGFDTTVCISPNQNFLLLPYLAGVERRASLLPNFGGRSYQRAARFLSHAEAHRQGRMTVESGYALLRHLGVTVPLPAKEIGVAAGAAGRVAALLPTPLPAPLVGLGISSGNKLKELGSDVLVEIGRGLLALDDALCIVLVGAAGDRAQADAVRAALPAGRVIDSVGRVALDDLAALLDPLALYLGVDSGITYLADARGIAVIDLMGPADADDQRPTGVRAIVVRPQLPCAPCSHAFRAPYACRIGTRACIAGVEAATVVALAALRLRNQGISP